MPTGNQMIDNMTDDELRQLKRTASGELSERLGIEESDSVDVATMSDAELTKYKSRVFRAAQRTARKRRVESEAREVVAEDEQQWP